MFDGEPKPGEQPDALAEGDRPASPASVAKSAWTVELSACWAKWTPPSFVVTDETTSLAFE